MSSVARVVGSDLCVGCGLCEAVTRGRVPMEMTASGSLRPASVDEFEVGEEKAIVSACPGVVAEPRADEGVPVDLVWGAHRSLLHAWAGDPQVRFEASTGGVLTALGQHLLRERQVKLVLHVGADPQSPLRSRWVVSETVEAVFANSGSRYGPAAPLAGLLVALDRDEPFAVIAKPCDLGAIHRYAAIDDRVDRLCIARLAMVCGGQSRLTKALAVLDGLGVGEDDVVSFRYRGNGNPGPTRVETVDGSSHTLSYSEMWADESTWAVETRCKFCPDALGEAADIAAADAWPGGAPVGEDAGFNAVVVRTSVGRALFEAAGDAGAVVVGEPITPRQFDDLQPHQVRKKVALAARYEGMTAAGVTPIDTPGLRVGELGKSLGAEAWALESEGARRRIEAAAG